MGQPRAAEIAFPRRNWTDSVIVDLAVAILLAWSAGWLGGKLGPDTWIVGGGLTGIGLAFVIAGCLAPSGRFASRVRELYLCLAAVYVGLEVIRCLILASGRNPDCGCPANPARAWDGISDVGYGLLALSISAVLGGGIAWLIRRSPPIKS